MVDRPKMHVIKNTEGRDPLVGKAVEPLRREGIHPSPSPKSAPDSIVSNELQITSSDTTKLSIIGLKHIFEIAYWFIVSNFVIMEHIINGFLKISGKNLKNFKIDLREN